MILLSIFSSVKNPTTVILVSDLVETNSHVRKCKNIEMKLCKCLLSFVQAVPNTYKFHACFELILMIH